MQKPYITVTIRLTASMRPVDGWVEKRGRLGTALLAELDAPAFVPPELFFRRLVECAMDGLAEEP